MKRLTMTAVAVLTLAWPVSLAQAQNPPKPPGADEPGGGGPGVEPKPGAPGRGGQGHPGHPAQGEQPGRPPNPGAGQPRPGGEQPRPGEGQPRPGGEQPRPGGEQPRSGEAQPRPGEAGRPGAPRPAPPLAPAQRQGVVTRFRAIDVPPARVDFDVRIGVPVPRTVVLRPVPPEIVDIVPGFEGFRFFVVPGEIVIVDPDTFEVVEVLPF